MAEENYCTVEDLRQVIKESKSEVPILSLLPSHLTQIVANSKTRVLSPQQIALYREFRAERRKTPQSQEVYPKIFIGEEGSAVDISHLKNAGITHIINVGCGKGEGEIYTSEEMYIPHGINFLAIELVDNSHANLRDHFETVFKFMDEALDTGNAIMVHCCLGVSRSPCVVIAYLMDRKGMTAVEAFRHICKRREILPNEGFLVQLAQFDKELRLKRAAH